MPTINIKGVGLRNFPDSMSENEIKAVLQKKFGKPETTEPESSGDNPSTEPENEQNEPFDPSSMIALLTEIRDSLSNPVASEPDKIDISPMSDEISRMSATIKNLSLSTDKALSFLTKASPAKSPDMSGIEKILKDIRGKQVELVALETERRVAYKQMQDDMQNTVYDIKRGSNGQIESVVTKVKDNSTPDRAH